MFTIKISLKKAEVYLEYHMGKGGLLFMTLSEEDCTNGGKWMVGDRFQKR